jgi:acyl carrier protein
MDKTALIEKVNTILSEEFETDIEKLTPDANIKKTLELDSLSLVDMIALIDNEFGVKIANSDLPKIQTFQALYDYLAANMK